MKIVAVLTLLGAGALFIPSSTYVVKSPPCKIVEYVELTCWDAGACVVHYCDGGTRSDHSQFCTEVIEVLSNNYCIDKKEGVK